MSQHPSSLVDPSQSQSDENSLHYHRCWWAWCRHNFYTKKDLLDHVVSEHVQKARPVRLADIHTLQAAENSYWDSLDFGSLPSSLPIQRENDSQASSRRQANPINVPSSLPSPPTSSPQNPGTPVREIPRADLFAEDEPLQVPRALVSPQLPNGILTPPSKHDVHLFTPSFTSLSSQPNSPNKTLYDVPDSPCFDLLVVEATRRPIQVLPESQDSNDSTSSPPEESSQEFVFNQLTQEIGGEEGDQEPESRSSNVTDIDSDGVPDAHQATLHPEPQSNQPDTQESNQPPPTPLQIQTHFLPTTTIPSSPSYFHSPTYPSATPAPRQPWYQPQRRRLSKKNSASEASVGRSSPATSPLAKAVTPITSPVPVNFLPAAVQAVQSPTSAAPRSEDPQPASRPQAQSQEESWTQTDSTQLSSYPFLTQAPLRSQSLSQD